MIEAMMMGGGVLGPAVSWSFIGSTNQLTRGPDTVVGDFPPGIQEGDLVIALMSPFNESIRTTMVAGEWAHWTKGQQDYLCTARYVPGLSSPAWQKAEANSLFVSVLVFRAAGWSTVRLESNATPAKPVNVTCTAANQLLLSIATTPGTTRGWVGHIPGELPAVRVDRPLAPAMHVYTANIDRPRQVSGIYTDASSGAERNLILSVY